MNRLVQFVCACVRVVGQEWYIRLGVAGGLAAVSLDVINEGTTASATRRFMKTKEIPPRG